MSADPQADRLAAVADLIGRLEPSVDSSASTVAQCARQVKDSDPALARLLERAALPRRLDAPLVAMLAEVDDDEGTRLLSRLTDYSFVRPHPSGGWAYHDRVRDAVRAQWASGPGAEDFRNLSQRLSRHMLGSFAESRRLARELQIATPTLLAVQPARLAAMRTAVEWYLVISFKEAVYHAGDAGLADVNDLFGDVIGQVESSPQLVEIALAALHGLPPDLAANGDPVQAGWLRYWEARLLMHLDQPSEAEAMLRPLAGVTDGADLVDDAEAAMGPIDDALRLRHWAAGDLGLCLEQQQRLLEAEAVYARDLRLAVADGVDAWNLGLAYQRLATLQLAQFRVTDAAESLRGAVDAARAAGNNRALVGRCSTGRRSAGSSATGTARASCSARLCTRAGHCRCADWSRTGRSPTTLTCTAWSR